MAVNSPRECSDTRFSLDSDGCVNLKKILDLYEQPLSEPHAWAVLYQCSKCFLESWKKRLQCYNIGFEDVRIHKDGSIHQLSITKNGPDSEVIQSESEIVWILSEIIFSGLYFNVENERELSLSLHNLMLGMRGGTDALTEETERHETDDEGIVQDVVPSSNNSSGGSKTHGRLEPIETLKEVIELCDRHYEDTENSEGYSPESHYRNVCSALVNEALSFSNFLEQVREGKELLEKGGFYESGLSNDHFLSNPVLRELPQKEWSKLWLDVMRQLRRGVKLKETGGPRVAPIEYELTPYEMLLNDIKAKKCHLKKISERKLPPRPKLPPNVEEKAHDLIMEFIRSRPPLKRMEDRLLPPPPPKQLTPKEQVCEAIKQGNFNLRRVESLQQTQAGESALGSIPAKKKLLLNDPCLSFLPNLDDLDDPDTEDDLETPTRDEYSPFSSPGSSSWKKAVALDLATQVTPYRVERRHSLSICESPCHARAPSDRPESSPAGNYEPYSLPPLGPPVSSLQTSLLNSSVWKQNIDCLALSLEELVHIRKVLTKAELEALLFDPNLLKSVAQGKICFGCRKTNFKIFGPRGVRCGLCTQVVCTRCCTKMRIPMEHFANIPVSAISPNTPSPGEDSRGLLTKGFFSRLPDLPKFGNTVGSAPSSPVLSRAPSFASSRSSTPTVMGEDFASLPASDSHITISESRSPAGSVLSNSSSGKTTKKEDKILGVKMTVCSDCSTMVRQIIQASNLILRQNQKKPNDSGGHSRPLYLNLSPVY